MQLQVGDLVILTSEGVPEAKNLPGEMFGFDRLQQAIKTGPEENPQAMLVHLQTALTAFTGLAEHHDDVTITILQMTSAE